MKKLLCYPVEILIAEQPITGCFQRRVFPQPGGVVTILTSRTT
jgi:hypothetical protein